MEKGFSAFVLRGNPALRNVHKSALTARLAPNGQLVLNWNKG
ncbi:hypothetical protein RX717_14905 [Intestinibacillus sp. NTUH-41-i26]|nr:hypothetical protein [Intestinibacillus sp. NTUH-41-i26]WOC75248.1 hypothetical protein RX717_14905 [Intestinibacillus sp. NTUH-41-i26]